MKETRVQLPHASEDYFYIGKTADCLFQGTRPGWFARMMLGIIGIHWIRYEKVKHTKQ